MAQNRGFISVKRVTLPANAFRYRPVLDFYVCQGKRITSSRSTLATEFRILPWPQLSGKTPRKCEVLGSFPSIKTQAENLGVSHEIFPLSAVGKPCVDWGPDVSVCITVLHSLKSQIGYRDLVKAVSPSLDRVLQGWYGGAEPCLPESHSSMGTAQLLITANLPSQFMLLAKQPPQESRASMPPASIPTSHLPRPHHLRLP